MQAFMKVYFKSSYRKSLFLVYNFTLWDRLIRALVGMEGNIDMKTSLNHLNYYGFCHDQTTFSLEIARKSLLLKSP